MLRDYQRRALDDLYAWFRAGNDGHPCMVLPTGSGKSHIIAGLCQEAILSWPGTRVMLLSHVKEIIEQDAAKMKAVWPNAPIGIYSAGIGKRELGQPITFAGVQSVVKRAQQIGHIDLLIVDEAHRISHKNEGGYRKLIDDLTEINPELRVVGLTATAHRLGHGMIHEGDALFDDILESVTINELIEKGYLCPLRSKVTTAKLSTDGVHKRGGEFIESELQAAVDTDDDNSRVAAEIVAHSEGHKSWLIFCSGVQHSHHVADELCKLGINAVSVTGEMSKTERSDTLTKFKSGEIQAICNRDILTTGFDHTGVDLIAMLRPTMSAGLYMQIAGRGLRADPNKDECLVLDFAGNVERHGPITHVQPPPKKGESVGMAPTKDCPECGEIVHASVMQCPACGHDFPLRIEKDPPRLRDDDIMGLSGKTMAVSSWNWEKHTSRRSGKEMLMCRYYGALSDPVVKEYVTLMHDGFAGKKALRTITSIAEHCGVSLSQFGANSTLDELADALNYAQAPSEIEYRRDGTFYRVLDRVWHQEELSYG